MCIIFSYSRRLNSIVLNHQGFVREMEATVKFSFIFSGPGGHYSFHSGMGDRRGHLNAPVIIC